MKEKNEFCMISNNLISQIEQKLTQWQSSIERCPTESLNMESLNMEKSCEYFDQANRESMLTLEIEKANRNKKILSEIRYALNKIKAGTYGICEESGETIEAKRLAANPLARYSLEAQQEFENELRKNRKQ